MLFRVGMGRPERAGALAVTKAGFTALQLSVSLALSVIAAVVLIKAAIYFDYQETVALALPVLPSLFPLFYKVLTKEPVMVAHPASGAPARAGFWRRHFSLIRSLRTVAVAVALSLGAKYGVEALFLYGLYRRSGLPFHVLFGEGGDSLLAYFLRGDLLTATAARVMPLLAAEMIVLSAVGALWIGCTSDGSPVLEGLLAGTVVALLATLTNLAVLYAHLESIAQAIAMLLDSRWPRVFPVTGLLVQVFLYGCCSMAVQQWRREHASRLTPTARSSRPTRPQPA
jgi:hypothetical protein